MLLRAVRHSNGSFQSPVRPDRILTYGGGEPNAEHRTPKIEQRIDGNGERLSPRRYRAHRERRDPVNSNDKMELATQPFDLAQGRQLNNSKTVPFGWNQVAWDVAYGVACRLLGHCLDIAKQPNGKSVGSHSEIIGCDTETTTGALLSNEFFSKQWHEGTAISFNGAQDSQRTAGTGSDHCHSRDTSFAGNALRLWEACAIK